MQRGRQAHVGAAVFPAGHSAHVELLQLRVRERRQRVRQFNAALQLRQASWQPQRCNGLIVVEGQAQLCERGRQREAFQRTGPLCDEDDVERQLLQRVRQLQLGQ